MPKRFDTHFFLAEMPATQEAAYDHLETTDGIWITPEEASAGYERGDFPLVFAQIHQLRDLHGLRSFDDARARFAGHQPPTIMPRVVERDGKPVILLPDEDTKEQPAMSASDALPTGVECILAPNPSLLTGPGTNTFLVADDAAGEVVVIDPGPDMPEHLHHIADAVAAHGKAQAILVTHGHPDHADGAAALRTLLGVPVYAWSREGVAATDKTLADGAVVPVGARRLRALYTPGHRFDHLCFLLEDADALFAGDLIAGVGTVVIAPPEGDLLEYMASLRRLLPLGLRLHSPGAWANSRRSSGCAELLHCPSRGARTAGGGGAGGRPADSRRVGQRHLCGRQPRSAPDSRLLGPRAPVQTGARTAYPPAESQDGAEGEERWSLGA